MTIVGIDLGTTNSLVSVFETNQARIIPNALGERFTPSVVSIDESGDILVGRAARDRLITHPEKSAALFKRHMGSQKKYLLGGREFRSEEISSFVLRSLKADAEAYLNEKVCEAVISVPAYFNDIQRKATRAAGQLAGLTVHRLINEPTAAAIAYGLHQGKDDAIIMVFDLGGGTFDVSILEFYSGVMEVHATAGDCRLGGEDFVVAIIKAFADRHGFDPETLDPADKSRIHQQAEQLMHQLSRTPDAVVPAAFGDRRMDWRLTREDFGEITGALQERLRRPVERAMLDASIQSKHLDEVVLVGGATRMPLVRSMAARMFGRIPSMTINPDEAVALGAAIQAGLKARDKALKEIVFTDVCPYTLGVEVMRHDARGNFSAGHFSPIIERGVVVPVSREERFHTLFDEQACVEVVIYQGESRLVKDNIQLGKLTVPVPPGPRGKEAVDVRFTYDIDGLLEVEVRVVSSGLKTRSVIKEPSGMLTADEIEQRLAALSELKVHPRDKLENRTLIARGERMYQSRLEESRERIAHALFDFEAAIECQQPQTITEARLALERLLQQLEDDGFAL
jgi:molecular chaperone HscC